MNVKSFSCGFFLFFLWLSCITVQAQSYGASESPSFHNALVDAADRGDALTIRRLIQEGTPVDSRGDFGATSLMRAALKGNRQVVEMLIEYGADTDAVDLGGATALHLATRQGNREIISLLLAADTMVDMPDNEGWTPLMQATVAKKTDIIPLLLESHASIIRQNDLGDNALTLAIKSEDKETVALLIEDPDFIALPVSEKKELLLLASGKKNQEVTSLIAESLVTKEAAPAPAVITAPEKEKTKPSFNIFGIFKQPKPEPKVEPLPSVVIPPATIIPATIVEEPVVKEVVVSPPSYAPKKEVKEVAPAPVAITTPEKEEAKKEKKKSGFNIFGIFKQPKPEPKVESLPPVAIPPATITEEPVVKEVVISPPSYAPKKEVKEVAPAPVVITAPEKEKAEKEKKPSFNIFGIFKQPKPEPKVGPLPPVVIPPATITEEPEVKEAVISTEPAVAKIKPQKLLPPPVPSKHYPAMYKEAVTPITPVAKLPRPNVPVTSHPEEKKRVEVGEAIRVPISRKQHKDRMLTTYSPSNSKDIKNSLWVQAGVYSGTAQAMAAYDAIKKNPLVNGMRMRIISPVRANEKGVSLRLGPVNAQDVAALCGLVTQKNISCSTVRDFGKSTTVNSAYGNYSSYVSPKNRKPAAANKLGKYWLQFGTFESERAAEQQRDTLKASHTLLQHMIFSISVPKSGSSKKASFRLRGGVFPGYAAATSMCDTLSNKKVSCIVVKMKN